MKLVKGRSLQRRHTWRATLVAVSLMALAAGSAEAQARPLVVDRDRAQCPNADFVSIQEAVAAAAPNDEIHVCPDLYTESVTVDKPLRLRGQVGAVQAEDCFAPAGVSDPTRQAIVDGGDYSFKLAANDIVLEGFVVEGATTGIDTDAGFSGYLIRHNLVQRNLLDGAELHSAGATETRAHDNCFRQNARGGLVSEHGNLHNARIDHNESFRNREGLVVAGPGSRVDVQLEHNVSINDLFGLGIQNSSASSVAHNKVTALPPAPGVVPIGVIIGGGNVGLIVSQNQVEGGSFGILFNTRGFLATFPASTGLQVVGNAVSNVQLHGLNVAADSVHHSRFSDNHVRDNGQDGIGLRSRNTFNTFERNHAMGNGRDGIRVGPMGAFNNVFEANQLRKNGEHDAHDDNRPANTWVNNHCETDFPTGTICGVS